MSNPQIKRRWIQFWTILLITALILVGVHPQPVLSVHPFQGYANKIALDLAKRIGRPLKASIIITSEVAAPPELAKLAKLDKGKAGAETFYVTQKKGKWLEAETGDKATCWIVWLSDLVYDPSGKSLLAHEVYHCFQSELTGASWGSQLPNWLIEGAAQWAGEEYAGGSKISAPSWNDYLSKSQSFFDRFYDGIGLYTHLKNTGVDVWKEVDQLLKTTSSDSKLIFAKLMGDVGDTFLQTWASGLARSPELGSEWDTTGPGITPAKRTPKSVVLNPSSPLVVEILPLNQSLYDITIPTGKVITVDIAGYGALRWGDAGSSSATLRFSKSFSKRYCVGESCRCEDGTQPTGIESVSGDRALLAVTSTAQSALVTIKAEESPCKKDPKTGGGGSSDGGGSSGSGSGAGGTKQGTSYGDPHLITFDGFHYSFQTVGEFLLAKAKDGAFEVQTRQAQVPGQPLSLNTAVAMKVGNHRVGFYRQNLPDSDPTPLRVDGKPTVLTDTPLALSGGGSIHKLSDRDYAVQWATGEQVVVRMTEVAGASFLNVTTSVSDTQSERFMGLLGNSNGNSEDDLQTRSGKVIPSESSYGQVTQALNNLLPTPLPLSQVENAFLQQLHREFGDSWRIRQEDSLFDYAPGQSTATFTDRSYPKTFLTLNSLLPDQIRSAESTCRTAGVSEVLLQGCIFDVGITGSPGFAQAAVNALAKVVVDRAVERVVDEVKNQIPVPIPISIPGFPF